MGESKISNEIFRRLAEIPLIDKYSAYQLLDDEWAKLSVDLEIVQTEGKEAFRRVDKNMVLKKRNCREEEVQEGWVGRIIPFDLVQRTLLADQKAAITDLECRLSEIASEYNEILEGLSEEEKEEISGLLNEDNSAFAAVEISL